MKRVLIISPHFPPSNAADMHRVRMSLGYFEEFGWTAELVCVEDHYSGIPKDPLLLKSVPEGTIIHYVKAYSQTITSKIGLGSLALRSMPFYRKAVDKLLHESHFDLIYFSTTLFPLCVLGAYWKRKHNIPYVIDMQDPWHSDYYWEKPKEQRPKKFWLSYRMHKYLEPIAMKSADGLISVSAAYIQNLKNKYSNLKDKPASVITFGFLEKDLEIAAKSDLKSVLSPEGTFFNLVYIGRGGHDMSNAFELLFEAVKMGVDQDFTIFKKLRCYFIGTSYAADDQSTCTVKPIADKIGVGGYVTEITQRIGFYETLVTLQDADLIFIPGSDDPKYTASKLYPYLAIRKPLIALFNEESDAVATIKRFSDVIPLTFNTPRADLIKNIYSKLKAGLMGDNKLLNLTPKFQEAGARSMTKRQTELFDKVVDGSN